MTAIYDRTWLMHSVVADRKRKASYGINDGRVWSAGSAYLNRCRAYHAPTGTVMLFSRDEGHHTSGWWKNPDYERCFHLSVSFKDPTTCQDAPRDLKLTKEWLEAFYGENKRLLWCEPPYTDMGKRIEVWHYRLFCDAHWQPIKPRGEVYSRELTEAGWKSFSDVGADLDASEELRLELAPEARP